MPNEKRTPFDRLYELIHSIPQEEARAMMQKAAALSAEPVKDVIDAIPILADQSTETPAGAALYQLAQQAEYYILQNNADKKISNLVNAAKAGKLRNAFVSMTTHNKQEAIEANDVIIKTGLFPGYNAKIDPESEEFNIDEYEAAIDSAGGIYAIIAKIDHLKATEYLQRTKITFTDTAAREAASVTDIEKFFANLRKIFNDFQNSEIYKELTEKLNAINLYLDENRAELETDLEERLEELSARQRVLLPFLKAELDAEKDNPKYSGYTLADIIKKGFDSEGRPTESLFSQLIKRAKQHLREYEEAEGAMLELENTKAELESAAAAIPRIIARNADLLNYPLDKPNSELWKRIANADGQIVLNLETAKKGSGQDAAVLLAVNFPEIKDDIAITKQLTAFDKLLYAAAGALYTAGNEYFSARSLYKTMGFKGEPNPTHIKKINDSLSKMLTSHLWINNDKELKAKYKYPNASYDAALLPFERISAIINGQPTEAIHLFREPPLIAFARGRNQITTIERKVLESPPAKTDENLRIQDYLIERIGRMKNEKSHAPQKILYDTLFKECEIKGKQRQRAPGKIREFLDYYKKEDSGKWIKDYKEEKDGITIIL